MLDASVPFQELTTRDPQHTARCFDDWCHEYTQISRGTYRGHIWKLVVPGLSIVREQVNVSLEQRGTCPPQSLAFSTFTQAGCHAKYPQDEFHFGDAQLHDDNFDRRLLSDKNADAITVTIDKSLLFADSPIPSRRHGSTIHLHAECMTAIARDCAIDALNIAQSDSAACANPQWREAVSRSFVDAVAMVIEKVPELPAPRLHTRRALVERARSALLDNEDVQLTVGTVCRQLHVSRRTLQLIFTAEFGMCPTEYVRAYRLNRCRDILRSATAGTTVIEVAARWGFWHPGRFAKYYRRLFDESPSDTLRRPI